MENTPSNGLLPEIAGELKDPGLKETQKYKASEEPNTPVKIKWSLMPMASSVSKKLEAIQVVEDYDPYESMQKYRPGGFYPILLGKHLETHGFCFHIINKLGSGGHSTVWLANETQSGRWVSLKICDSDSSTEKDWNRENLMTSYISNRAKLDRQPIANIDMRGFSFAGEDNGVGGWASFHFEGPNGFHLSLVSDVYGPSLWEVVDAAAMENKDYGPGWHRSVAKNAARALAYLHSGNIIHGGKSYRKNSSFIPDVY
jgi:serine/threonine protein kinase